MKLLRLLPALLLSLLAAGSTARLAAETDPALQPKIDAKIAEVKTWAADPAIVAAVVAQNTAMPADYASMNQDTWKGLTVLHPLVRGLSRNPTALILKSHKADWVAEAFLNDASGAKVAVLSKPSSWSHGTSAKHTDPMAGKVWQGTAQIDESSGLQQIQVAVPVLSEGKPVGSLVVGISVTKLE